MGVQDSKVSAQPAAEQTAVPSDCDKCIVMIRNIMSINGKNQKHIKHVILIDQEEQHVSRYRAACKPE